LLVPDLTVDNDQGGTTAGADAAHLPDLQIDPGQVLPELSQQCWGTLHMAGRTRANQALVPGRWLEAKQVVKAGGALDAAQGQVKGIREMTQQGSTEVAIEALGRRKHLQEGIGPIAMLFKHGFQLLETLGHGPGSPYAQA